MMVSINQGGYLYIAQRYQTGLMYVLSGYALRLDCLLHEQTRKRKDIKEGQAAQ